MDEYDLNNLNFILNLKKKDLDEWWDTISSDDREYAMELLRCYRLDLIDQAVELSGDYTLANEVIDRVRAIK